MRAVVETFQKVFSKKPSTSENVVLRRLFGLYGEWVVCEAVKLSAVVVKGSPIKYINAVANNLSHQGVDNFYEYIRQSTLKQVDDLESYEKSR